MLDNGGNLAPRQPASGLRHPRRWRRAGLRLAAGDHRPGRRRGAGPHRQGRQIRRFRRLARRHACEEWLRGYLAEGPKPAKECEQAAMAAGFNRPLLERARAALAIRSVRSGFGKGSCCHLCCLRPVVSRPAAPNPSPAHGPRLVGASSDPGWHAHVLVGMEARTPRAVDPCPRGRGHATHRHSPNSAHEPPSPTPRLRHTPQQILVRSMRSMRSMGSMEDPSGRRRPPEGTREPKWLALGTGRGGWVKPTTRVGPMPWRSHHGVSALASSARCAAASPGR